MDATTLSAIASAFGLAAPLLIAVVFVWVVWRTESRHMLVRRLWLLVHGSHDIADQRVRDFVDQQTSLMSFRLFSGVAVSTLQQAHQLLEWTEHNGISMRTLRVCGNYFDADLRQVRVDKLPSTFRRYSKAVWFFVMASIGGVSAGLTASDRVLLTLKATQRTFLVNASEARLAWPPWPFEKTALHTSQCSATASGSANTTGMSKDEIRVWCEILQPSIAKDFVKAELRKQRWALVFLAVFMFWAASLALVAWASARAATELSQRKLSPQAIGAQLHFDWPNNG